MRKPPPGYVVLEDVVDLIGGVVAGSTWQRLPDKTKPEERFNAVWSDPDVDRVITTIAEACENGRVEAAYETILGADRLDQEVWRMPHWRNFFASGTIDLDLPLLDDKLVPVSDGRTARCTRQIFIRRDSLERFMAPLTASSAAVATTRYPGDAALIEEGRRMLAGGMQKRAIARELAQRAEGAGTFESKVDRLRRLL
jgi:hypothetical protein